jgi:hypothetical protein
MKTYVGTKTVKAEPMLLGEYLKSYRRNPYSKSDLFHSSEEEGYLVVYPDGYKSWSPKLVFEEAYKLAETFKDRLLIEKQELEEKLNKLDAFINSSEFPSKVPDGRQRGLLAQQQIAMHNYLDALNDRINSL